MNAEPLRERRREVLLPSASASLFAGKYRVSRVVGRGGMGLVFAARHLKLGHEVAIKVLGSAVRTRPEIVRRFEREAAAMARLTGRHAVRVLDADMTDDGVPYFVMELLAGCDLRSILLRGGPQPMDQAARWIIEACRGVGEAHRNGIVHRDLKPSNLFLANDDGGEIVKVLDFGIAKMDGARDVIDPKASLGTPPYMAPEQMLCAEAVDHRADVWSLGVTLYELVTGVLPLAGRPRGGEARRTLPDPRLLRPSLTEREAATVMRALRERPDERYPSVEAFAQALSDLAVRSCASEVSRCQAPSRTYTFSAAQNAMEVRPFEDEEPLSTVTGTMLDPQPSPAPKSIRFARPLVAVLLAAALAATCRPGMREDAEEASPNLDVASAGSSLTSLLDLALPDEDLRVLGEARKRSSHESDDAGTRGIEASGALRRAPEGSEPQ